MSHEDQNTIADQKCPVCLQPFEDEVILDACFHAFCRFCITQWAEYEPAKRHGLNHCPLCRTHFTALLSNYSDHTQSYEIQHMEEEEASSHWSQYYEHRDAISQQKSASKNLAVLRQRRLYVYSNNLIPIIDFKIISIPTEPSRRNIVFNKMMTQFQSKGYSFLLRELPILLLHDQMKFGLKSLQTQQNEVELIIELVKSHFEDGLSQLVKFISLRSSHPVNFSDLEVVQLLRDNGEDLASFDLFYDSMHPFLLGDTLCFIRELALLVLSPYTLAQFDTQIVYQDPRHSANAETKMEINKTALFDTQRLV